MCAVSRSANAETLRISQSRRSLLSCQKGWAEERKSELCGARKTSNGSCPVRRARRNSKRSPQPGMAAPLSWPHCGPSMKMTILSSPATSGTLRATPSLRVDEADALHRRRSGLRTRLAQQATPAPEARLAEPLAGAERLDHRPLAANRAKTVSHSWRLRRRHCKRTALTV